MGGGRGRRGSGRRDPTGPQGVAELRTIISYPSSKADFFMITLGSCMGLTPGVYC